MLSHAFKINRRLIISTMISISIILLFMIYILWINLFQESHQYKAVEGRMDLKHWDGYRETNISLEGEWAFYPHVLITPEDDFTKYEHIKKYIDVPGSWESYLDEDGRVDGSGTYRLRIQLSKDDIYGIKSRTIRTSSRIFINHREIISVGKPSQDRAAYVAQSLYKTGFSESENQELDIIVNVSSYDYITGGITSPIEFGRYESILNKDRIARGMDAMAISISFVLGVYFFVTYFQRGKGKDLLYFSLTSVSICIYLSTLNEQLLYSLFHYSQNIRMQIHCVAIMLTMTGFLKFIYYSFQEYSNKKRIHTIIGLILLSGSLAFFTVDGTSFITIEFSQHFVLATALLAFIKIFYILIKSIIKKAESLGYILIFTSTLFTCWIAALLTVLFELELGNTMIVLVFTMLISGALLMGNNLQMDYKNVQSLSNKLLEDDKLKDEFLARASHELKTPLHVILNLTETLIEGQKGTMNEKQQESLFFIHQEGRRLANLVEDLLSASQWKEGGNHLHLTSVNAYHVVEDILREIQVIIPKNRNLRLVNKIPEDFPDLKADHGKFIQIIYNLLNNSIKYTLSGEITISASIKDQYGVFHVIDTGLGMKEEELDKIFNKFYRKGDHDTAEIGLGLGLGLPVVKQLVEVQDGTVDVQSTYGKGSTFCFTIPLQEVQGRQGGIPKFEQSQPSHLPIAEKQMDEPMDRPTLLIVDDEISNQRVLKDILREARYHLIFADNGRETMIALEDHRIDLIILDLMLPDMSGDTICKEIRQKYSMVELPIIILTASGRVKDLKNIFECGANDFIRKPADAQELMTRIRSLLSMKKSVAAGINRELQYFYSQISPHFLYNTLNTIIGLSEKDPHKTREALVNLSIYFRGKLDLYKEEGLIPLQDELELVAAYLEIEQMRYGHRLKVELDVDEDIPMMIPPLTLQPLVENAIGHGIGVKKEGGTIKILVKKNADLVTIILEDNGVGMSAERREALLKGDHEHLGFRNVMEKMKLIKGASLELESQESKGSTITITIPATKWHRDPMVDSL